MMAFTWRMLSPRPVKGARTYRGTSRFPHTRERLCLAARHHMLLRDEDIRNLNLSDTFHIMQRHPCPGSQLPLGLVFCITRGKANNTGVKLHATAFRHKDFLRCTMGAFAFYMFERFMVHTLCVWLAVVL